MNLDLVFPRLPPALDGIGDYTARLAGALAAHARVRILTAEAAPAAIPGVEIRTAFGIAPPHGVARLAEAIDAAPPDWLGVQYNPFSYGRWGWNPHLPRTLRALRHRHPSVRLALTVHEVAPPLLNARLALMSTWQLAHLWALGRMADVVFAAIEPWVAPMRRWFGTSRVHHLPVGSNIPYAPAGRAEARAALGLPDPAFAVGVFGTAHPTRLLGFVRTTVETLREAGADARVLYVGPDGEAVRARLGGLPLLDAGRVPARDVSRHFAAMDLYLAPFRRGVSTRRGSFVAALQHGVPTLATAGSHTGALLRAAGGDAFALAPDDDAAAFAAQARALHSDPARRAALGQAGRAFFARHHAWDVLAARLAGALALPTLTPAA
ncbi:MAG: glycosyltransferase [Rhodothermales bacterium]|nr:glycosyltransferase [Rhodothermales bacterium]